MTFNATNNQVFSNALFYSNTPSYWEATGLPTGLALSVDLNSAGTDVQASIVGTPTGGTGTMTATIHAVNVLRSNAPQNSAPATNINTITFNFGTPPPTFLSYGNWLINYPTLTGAETNRTADPDGDGFDNNKEYAFDGNPTVGTPSLLSSSNNGSSAVFRFTGLKGAEANYTVQNTTNLSTTAFAPTSIPVTLSSDQTGLLIPLSYDRREFSVPLSATNNFYRVIFTDQ